LIVVTMISGAVHAYEAREIEVLDTSGNYRNLREEDLEAHTHQEVSPAIPVNIVTANPGGAASGGRAWGPTVVNRRANDAAIHRRRNNGMVILPPPLPLQPALPFASYSFNNSQSVSRRNAEFLRCQQQAIQNNRLNMTRMTSAARLLQQGQG
jgi:hypothetical protein